MSSWWSDDFKKFNASLNFHETENENPFEANYDFDREGYVIAPVIVAGFNVV